MKLQWHGPVWDQSGYAEINREMLFALDRLGVQVALKPTNIWSNESIELEYDDFCRLVRMTNNKWDSDVPTITYQRYNPEIDSLNVKYLYLYTLFETDRFPKSWLYNINRFIKIFTFTEFNRQHWIKNNGFDENKLINIGFGINHKRFNTDIKKPNILNKKGFTFITNGDFVERKGFDILLKAYIEEFSVYEDVCLIMKVHYGGFTNQHKKDLKNWIKSYINLFNKNKYYPRILFYGDKIGQDEIPKFYTTGDCFVLPSRGEGLGMPFLEAMACGLPVISSKWSAMTDFIKDGYNGFMIDGEERYIDSVDFIRRCPHSLNHKWFETDIEKLKQKMRYCFENRDKIKIIGNNAHKSSLKYHWHDVALKIIKEIYQ